MEVLFEQEEITDLDKLARRAQNGISDLDESKSNSDVLLKIENNKTGKTELIEGQKTSH